MIASLVSVGSPRTGTNTMAETVAIDRPSVAKPTSRPRSRKPATVSASALARHLDCSRAYIGKLEADGVIHTFEKPLQMMARIKALHVIAVISWMAGML